MSDTSHWIYVPGGINPQEITQAFLLDNWKMCGPHTYLVPGRVWRDYKEREAGVAKVLTEIQCYNKPQLTVVAPYAKKEEA